MDARLMTALCQSGSSVPLAISSATGDAKVGLKDLSEVQLCSKILGFDKAATDMAKIVRGAVELTLKSVIEAGQHLIEAKSRLQHGEWGTWLVKYLPNIPQSRACPYMALAERISHVRNLDEIQSVRQAYIACDIIKEKGNALHRKGSLSGDFTAVDFVARVKSFRGFLEATSKHFTVSADAAVVDELTGEIAALTQVFENLRMQLKTIDIIGLPEGPKTVQGDLPLA